MVEIGGKPILWHIMKIYSPHGVNEFIVCLGYKGYMIKEYFANYFLHMSDVTIDIAHEHDRRCTSNDAEPWTVTLVDTGERHDDRRPPASACARYLGDDEDFCLTYGDGVGDVDIGELVDFHREPRQAGDGHRGAAAGRFGALELDGDAVVGFREKPRRRRRLDQRRLLRPRSPEVLDYIEGDDMRLGARAAGAARRARASSRPIEHDGFWQPMDTLRDKNLLEELWDSRAGAVEDLA